VKTIVLLLLCIFSVAADAAIYGYVDAKGAYHLSSTKLDSRYSLISQGTKFQSGSMTSVGNSRRLALGRVIGDPRLVRYEPLLRAASDEFFVDFALLKAVMTAESGYNPDAVSPKGAIGLMQIMPATAERFGLTGSNGQSVKQKLFDPETNIRLGTRYLASLFEQFPGRQDLVLASYNAGEGAVRQYGKAVPPYVETRNYLDLVTQLHEIYSTSASVTGPRAREPAAVSSAKRVYLTINKRERLTVPTRKTSVDSVGILSTEIQQLNVAD
jgi:hypothetical protein